MSLSHLVPTTKILYYFYQDGCSACAFAKPELEKFKAAHPEIMVMECNLSRKDWFISGWTPKVTPGYLLKVNNEAVGNVEGALNLKLLEKWHKSLTGEK